MTAAPQLAVVVSVRDDVTAIGATLAGLIGQKDANWTAVLVVDGSTAAAALRTTAARRDSRITVVATPPLGPAQSRMAGLDRVRADWVLFLDAGAVLRPGHLAALGQAAGAAPPADVHCQDWCLTDERGQDGPRRPALIDAELAAILAAGGPFPLHAALIRVDALRAAGGFDPALSAWAAADLWLRLARRGATFRRAPGPVAALRLTRGGSLPDLAALMTAGQALIRRAREPAPHLPPLSAEAAAEAETQLRVCLAGRGCAAGLDAGTLLSAALFGPAPAPDAYALATTLIDGMTQGAGLVRPDWPTLWAKVRANVEPLLASVEDTSHCAGLAAITLTHVERCLAQALPARTSARIGATLVQTFDLDAPRPIPASTADRLIGIPCRVGHEVGRFECFAELATDPAALEAILQDFHDAPALAAAPSADDGRAGLAAATAYRDGLFAREDPWDDENPFEALKYDQTLAALPGRVGRALELACAEGFFTRRLAPMADHLLATDISPRAVARARQRLGDATNVEVAVLDFQHDPLPENLDLIVCNDVLYYLPDRDALRRVAARLAAALRPGGHLLMTHPSLIADAPDATGFDWPHSMGARTIARDFAAVPDLRTVGIRAAAMYQILLLRKTDAPASPPPITPIPHARDLPPAILRHLHWCGSDSGWAGPVPNGVAVLTYHRITDAPLPGLARWAVAPAAFQVQMRWLADNGFSVISLADFAAAAWDGAALPDRPVLLTFDDGYCDLRANALPVLHALGLTATVFLPTGHIGQDAAWDSAHGAPSPLMSWSDLAELRAMGLTFGAHGHHHLPMSALPFAALQAELTVPPGRILHHLGQPVETLAYPYGLHDEAVQRAALAAGYRIAFTTQSRRWQRGDRIMAVPRIEVPGNLDLDGFARLLST